MCVNISKTELFNERTFYVRLFGAINSFFSKWRNKFYKEAYVKFVSERYEITEIKMNG